MGEVRVVRPLGLLKKRAQDHPVLLLELVEDLVRVEIRIKGVKKEGTGPPVRVREKFS
jgi:hypothetical protein